MLTASSCANFSGCAANPSFTSVHHLRCPLINKDVTIYYYQPIFTFFFIRKTPDTRRLAVLFHHHFSPEPDEKTCRFFSSFFFAPKVKITRSTSCDGSLLIGLKYSLSAVSFHQSLRYTSVRRAPVLRAFIVIEELLDRERVYLVKVATTTRKKKRSRHGGRGVFNASE